jgi:hypothetical protein
MLALLPRAVLFSPRSLSDYFIAPRQYASSHHARRTLYIARHRAAFRCVPVAFLEAYRQANDPIHPRRSSSRLTQLFSRIWVKLGEHTVAPAAIGGIDRPCRNRGRCE